MKKIILASALSLVLLVVFGLEANAQMAKEGTFSGKAVLSATIRTLAMGEERLQLNYDCTGAFLNDANEGFLHKTSFHMLGALHAVKGVMENDHSFIMFSDKDGDKLYLTHEGTGSLDTAERIWKWVGGTGKYTGIQGGGGWYWVGTPHVVDGTLQGILEIKGHYKLP